MERVAYGGRIMTMTRSVAIGLALLAAPARTVHAQNAQQVSVVAAAPTRADTTVHRLPIDASRLQPAQFVYRLSLLRDTVASELGDQHFTVSVLTYAGTPALLFAREGMQGVAALNDSLIVRHDDLRPLHWIALHGVARVAAEFTPDSVFGAMSSPLGKQNVVLRNRADLLVNPMAVDMALSALPLAMTWRDSTSLLLLDSGGSVLVPATIAVEGEDHVTVSAGDFDCWIVSLESERGSERLWVTKQGQIVVRAEQVLPELGGAILTRQLVRSDSPSLPAVSARLPQ
jgi:hypothetical protein